MFHSYLQSFDYSVLMPEEEEERVAAEENLKYTQFLQACDYRGSNYAELMERSNTIIDTLTDLTVKYDNVTKETQQFQSKSDSLIDEHSKYVHLNEELKIQLHYYELLESFTRRLNSPSPNIVRRESFKRMLEQLDQCMLFMEQHPDHKEHDVFTRRFKQCLIRSLTLVRNYVVNNLKSVRDEISSKLNNTKTAVTQDALIYTRFGSDCAFLKDVTVELCDRASEDEEFLGLLNDCYDTYFGIRSRFLRSRLYTHFQSHADGTKSLVQHAQGNISYLTKLLQDEFNLFYEVFPRDYDNCLIQWFKRLSEPLYDDLRNIILRERSLDALCEMITLLDKYYEYDEPLADDFEEPQFESVNLGQVFEPVLQDVQSRLVFRVQLFAEENIVKYTPTHKDVQIGGRKQTVNDDEFMGGKKATGDWYPPLIKGVGLLSKIYELVSSSVFDDLAHNIVHDCIISLKNAYALALSIGPLDAHLFLLKNLLMLKEQLQQYDIEYVSSDTALDFSGIGDIIQKIREGTSVFSEGGLLGLVQESVPRVVRSMIDARQELQLELRNVVHLFTDDAVKLMVEPLSREREATALDDCRELRDNIESMLPRFKTQIEVFITEAGIITALIDGIQELLVLNYEKYYNDMKVADMVEVDTMVAFIGQVVSRMFEDSPADSDEPAEPSVEQLSLE